MPLFVDTPMVARLDEKPKSISRLGVNLSAEDIAQVIWQAATVKNPPVHYYPGLQTRAFAILQKWLPERLFRYSTKLIASY